MVFIGRRNELERLRVLRGKRAPGLVVVKGRRRVGKSRLINHFASANKVRKYWDFAGLAPEKGVDAKTQRAHFGRQLAMHLNVAPFSFTDWSDAFDHLSHHLREGDIVLFDEISWMGIKDPTFIAKLKAWWDRQTLPITMVFCGSVSTWIEKNILKSAAFFGRVNLTLTLDPLPIPDAYEMIKAFGFKGSDYDTLKLLSVLGGIPWYLEQVSPGFSADDLIKQLCFEKDSLLVLEFDRIFHDLFDGKGASYKRILEALKEGSKLLSEIRQALDFAHSGTLSQYLDHLVTAGFVRKQTLWSFKTIQPLKQSLYRICDPYMRFYLKLIEPNRNKIDLGGFSRASLSAIPGFDAHIGLQLEQLLLQNRPLLLKAMGINPSDVVMDGPYRQSKTSVRNGCQIDYLVQTSTKNLFICEFKFRRRELGIEVIKQVKERVSALKVPRGYASIPILFHVGGVTSGVATDDYFYRVIDISELLHESR